MFLLDDILLAPIKGAVWVAEKVHEAAQEGMAEEGEAVTRELSELYRELESGRIVEAEFDAREKRLLDRLERLPRRRPALGA